MGSPTILGDDIHLPAAWTFASPVADHFDTHVARSVPQYATGHRLVVDLASHFIRPGGTVYDVGCSTGALLSALDQQHRARAPRLVGLDVEPDMVRAARRRFKDRADVELTRADARTYPWQPACLIIAHYTIQFIPIADRPPLLAALHDTLTPGGALLWFEKTLAPTPRLQDVTAQTYTDHKLTAGYTPSEILAKTRSLRGVLAPLTSAENRALLRTAGFKEVMTVHQHLAFEGVLAIKTEELR